MVFGRSDYRDSIRCQTMTAVVAAASSSSGTANIRSGRRPKSDQPGRNIGTDTDPDCPPWRRSRRILPRIRERNVVISCHYSCRYRWYDDADNPWAAPWLASAPQSRYGCRLALSLAHDAGGAHIVAA